MIRLRENPLVRRRPNAEYRTREYLSEHEVEQLIDATKGNRQAHRDGTMILLAFRHGLRAAELETGVVHVQRAGHARSGGNC